jgi:cobyrinic acid a,c-diamide synthase
MAHETGSMGEFGKIIKEFCNLDAICACANTAPALPSPKQQRRRVNKKCVRIGIARDDAFCFYYQDNLDRLQTFGADLVLFSPMTDPLPDVDALYIGGGYPELHLPELESSGCTREIHAAADAGMPVYGECGGLLYLTREMKTDRTYRLCGVLPGVSEMTPRVQALGYVQGESHGDRGFVPSSQRIIGHEFHYSRVLPDRDAQFAFTLARGKGIDSGKDGLISVNALGTYTHAYFSDASVENFINAARRFSNR